MKPHGGGGLSDYADHAQLLADEDERAGPSSTHRSTAFPSEVHLVGWGVVM